MMMTKIIMTMRITIIITMVTNDEINILDLTKTRISISIDKISQIPKIVLNNSWMITDARRKGMHSRTKQKLITMLLDHK